MWWEWLPFSSRQVRFEREETEGQRATAQFSTVSTFL
jgi:hypothetical protein